MTTAKVYITRMIDRGALDKIAQVAEMKVWLEEIPPPRDVLLQEVEDIDGLLTQFTDKIDALVLQKAPRLKVISNYAVGYDNIDINEANKRGILVGHTPGILTETTADFAFTLLMAAARRVVEADIYTRKGKWKAWRPTLMLGHDIHQATLGIVGLGRIGKAVARRAQGFGMKVLYNDVIDIDPEIENELNVENASLERLLKESDFVTLHVSLVNEGPTKTYHLIGEKELSLMKPTAILINSSRGSVVDQKALYKALKSQWVRAAAIDVMETEPISNDDPLLALDNLIITPHIASASLATRSKMATLAADNLISGISGYIPVSCVNPEASRNRGDKRNER